MFEQHRPGKNDGYPVTLCMKPLLLQAVRMGTALVHPDVSTVRSQSCCVCDVGV